jgi:hypothetical protein
MEASAKLIILYYESASLYDYCDASY